MLTLIKRQKQPYKFKAKYGNCEAIYIVIVNYLILLFYIIVISSWKY